MNTAQSKALQEPFPAEAIGKLPKLTCKACSDKHCQEHKKQRCKVCGNYISTAHIDLDYVGHAATTARLLAVDPDWTWEPAGVDQYGLPVFDQTNGLWIKLTVAGVSRYGYGDGKSVKECIGDAIRNGAMRFGVALDLWANEDLSNITSEIPPTSLGGAGESTAHEASEPASQTSVATTDASSAVLPASAPAGDDAGTSSGAGEGAHSPSAPDAPVAQGDVGNPGGDEEGVGSEAVLGNTAEDPASDTYLTKEEQRVFAKAFGTQAKAVKAARERFGDRIRGLSDLTRDMAREMVANRQAAA